jgi:hypothetical protein
MGFMPISLHCTICHKGFSVRPCRAKTAKYCCYRCHQIGEGRKGGKIRGEQIKLLSQGKAYTKIGGRHKHRVIAESAIRRSLLPKEVVHHKDGNILNNHPDNLEILPSQGEHMRRHHRQLLQARKEKHGY